MEEGLLLNKVDEKDLKILSILRRNVRTPYTAIARELNVSEAAVRKRVEKLVRMGVIKRFTIDYELKNEVRAIVMVKTMPPISTPEVSKKIITIDGVEAVYETTGDYDILVVIRGSNITMINKSIDAIRSIEGVSGTNSMIVLRTWL